MPVVMMFARPCKPSAHFQELAHAGAIGLVTTSLILSNVGDNGIQVHTETLPLLLTLPPLFSASLYVHKPAHTDSLLELKRRGGGGVVRVALVCTARARPKHRR
jgi:hypothetical protein